MKELPTWLLLIFSSCWEVLEDRETVRARYQIKENEMASIVTTSHQSQTEVQEEIETQLINS